jgi:hypothetical protein
MTTTKDQVVSKQGEPIEKGDHVYTKIRGGRHEGDVRLFPCFSDIETSLPEIDALDLIHNYH